VGRGKSFKNAYVDLVQIETVVLQKQEPGKFSMLGLGGVMDKIDKVRELAKDATGKYIADSRKKLGL